MIHAQPKPKRGEHRKKVKAARRNDRKKRTEAVRPVIFDKANGICVCCRRRIAESMHEDRPKSLFGNRNEAISLENSLAVCGSGTTGCHGHLQAKRIKVTRDESGRRIYTPVRPSAQRWMEGIDR